MIIDFKARRTTLVASPVDGRSGIPTLTTLAESLLGIPITKGEDYVVFVSRSRKVCKIVFWDERGGMHGRASSQRRTVCAISDESVRTCGGPHYAGRTGGVPGWRRSAGRTARNA